MTPTSLRSYRIPSVVALALLVVLSVLVNPAAAAASSAVSAIEDQFLSQVNNERATRGLPAVLADTELGAASSTWSDRMAGNQNLRHSTDGRAEIIARGYWTGQITDAWMHSDGHRNLIVDPNLRWAGVGVTCDASGQIWATIQFRRLDATVGTLRSSSLNPISTPPDAGSGCNDDPYTGGVMRLYQAFFRRESDASGLAYWVAHRSQGTSLDWIASFFVGSAEFQETYGSLSNRDFVDLIYRNVLRRPADGGGFDYWVSLLDRRILNRGQLMVQFSESLEFRDLTGIKD